MKSTQHTVTTGTLYLLSLLVIILVGIHSIMVNCHKQSTRQGTADIQLPSNCSTSLSVVFPTEILTQALIQGDAGNFTQLYLNFMIASHRQGILLTDQAISSYSSNAELISLLQELKTNMTQVEQQLVQLLSTLQLESMVEVQTLVYGEDCSLRAASFNSVRGPCDFIFIMIQRLAIAKTWNLLALAISEQIAELAENELVNSSNTIEQLLQIANSSNCFMTQQ